MPRRLITIEKSKSQEMGARIRDVRKEQGLSLKAAAEILNIGFQTLIRYEKGENSPTADVLQRLLEHSPSIDAGWLLEGKGEMIPDFRNILNSLRSHFMDSGQIRTEELGSEFNNVMVNLARLPDNVRIGECRDVLEWASRAAVEIIGQAQANQRNENSWSDSITEIYGILFDKGIIDTLPPKINLGKSMSQPKREKTK